MLLEDIVENSNYVTDESLEDSNLLGMANTCIAEVNAKCKTNLPLFTEDNVSTTAYAALLGTWCLRLVEPYLAYSIASNDTDDTARTFHYNRFLAAVEELKDSIDSAILTADPSTGEETGYEGDSTRMVNIDASDYTFPWEGWF